MDDQGPEVATVKSFPVSSVLAARLAENDAHWKGGSAVESGGQQIAVSQHLKVGGAETCMLAGIPHIQTSDVHDVTSGGQPQGDIFFCDMLSSIHTFQPGERVLDFGCSTGRVIRNLKAALPFIEAEGCDPRASSIEFISKYVPQVLWFTSNETPPLPDKADDRYDTVFAISVWSHFRESAALAWFAEMARVIRPGGSLIFSTHSERSIYHFENIKNSMRPQPAVERRATLAKGDLHFARYPASDLNSDWGMAFIPRTWIEQKLASDWEITFMAPGLAMRNQDVYILKRR